jgi:ribosomal silencing factor RsfS
MEKLILKGKKEVKNLLIDSLHQTIQALGVSKSTKKRDKLVTRSAKRIASSVAKQLKKEMKKSSKNQKKGEGKKKELVSA